MGSYVSFIMNEITSAMITYYYKLIIAYYYIIITSLILHYYTIITSLLQMGNHVIMILLLPVMQRGCLYYYYYNIIITPLLQRVLLLLNITYFGLRVQNLQMICAPGCRAAVAGLVNPLLTCPVDRVAPSLGLRHWQAPNERPPAPKLPKPLLYILHPPQPSAAAASAVPNWNALPSRCHNFCVMVGVG